MTTSCCAATTNRELFRAVLRHPDLAPFHEEARLHLRHLQEASVVSREFPKVEETVSDCSSLQDEFPRPWQKNGGVKSPVRFSVDIPDVLWQEHVRRYEQQRVRRTSLHYNVGDYSNSFVLPSSSPDLTPEEAEMRSQSLPVRFTRPDPEQEEEMMTSERSADHMEECRRMSDEEEEVEEDEMMCEKIADKMEAPSIYPEDTELPSVDLEQKTSPETWEPTINGEVVPQMERRTSTVTTVVIEKRQRVLDSADPETEEKSVFLSSLFRYSKDYSRERERLKKANAASTFLRVIRTTFERYREELHSLSASSTTMFEEQKESDTDDNSVAVMMSLCDMCESEAAIIDHKLQTSSENSDDLQEDERQSLCRLLDTFVKMLDELKNEMVRIRRISGSGSSLCQPIPERVVEHFV